MYDSMTTVTVGLDVHARSIPAGGGSRRRAARGADAALRRGGGRAAVAPLAGGALLLRGGPDWVSVSTAISSAGGSTARWWRRAWCRSGRVTGSRPTRRDARKLARCSRAGCSSRSMCPRPSWRRPVIWCVRVRTRALIGCATGTGSRSSVCATGAVLPTSSWTLMRRRWLSEQRFEFAAQQQTFDTYVHTVDLVDARIEAAGAGDPRDGRAGAVA